MNTQIPARHPAHARRTDDDGPGLAEYGMVLAVIALIAILALSYAGQGLVLLLGR